MNLITLNRAPTKEEALEIVDQLRADIESGEVVAIFAVGVQDDDATNIYLGTCKPISRLRITGSVTEALHSFMHGDVL